MTKFKHLSWSLNHFVQPVLFAALMLGLLSVDAAAQQKSVQEAAAKTDSPATVFTVNRSAVEMAKTLSSQMRDRREVLITPDVHSNVLIVRGHKEAVEEVKGYLKVLDTPFQTVTYKVTIAVSGDGPDIRILDELELSTLDNNKAKLQFGQQVAVPTGATQVSSGRTIRNYSRQDAGTIVQVQPRVANGKILTDISLEKSWIEAPMSKSENDVDSQHTTFSVSFDSTLALQDDVAETIRIKATGSPGGQRSVVMTVSASVQSSKERASLRESKPSGRDAASSMRGTPSRRTMPPVKSNEGRSSFPGRPSAPPNPRATKPNPFVIQSGGSRQLFSRIDSNKDQAISQSEWDAQRISKILVSRGFKFSDGMNDKQFVSAMSDMVKTLRKRPTADKQTSHSSLGKNDAGKDATKDRAKGDGKSDKE